METFNALFHPSLLDIKMIPWKMTQKQALVPQNSTYSILRTFSSPLDIMG